MSEAERNWQRGDIVMCREYPFHTQKWFGYVIDGEVDSFDQLQVRWYNCDLRVWLHPSEVSVSDLFFIGPLPLTAIIDVQG